jgi:hypothetical protein
MTASKFQPTSNASSAFFCQCKGALKSCCNSALFQFILCLSIFGLSILRLFVLSQAASFFSKPRASSGEVEDVQQVGRWRLAARQRAETEGAAPSPDPSSTQALVQKRRRGSVARLRPQLQQSITRGGHKTPRDSQRRGETSAAMTMPLPILGAKSTQPSRWSQPVLAREWWSTRRRTSRTRG